MADRSRTSLSRATSVALAVAMVFAAHAFAASAPAAAPAKKKPPVAPLSGTLSAGATFPQRALLLTVPPKTNMDPSHVHVAENGTAISSLTSTPLTQALAGDSGVMLVIDKSPSMSGAPLASAMAAARAFAAQRSPNEELGVIMFDGNANVTLPLTSDPRLISQALAAAPWAGTGTHILSAMTLALQELRQAKVAAGAVILLSDGGDWEPGIKLTAKSVAMQAKAMGVPLFTIGLKDSHYSPGFMRELAKVSGGKFAESTGSQLTHVFTTIGADLSQEYLIRYESSESHGQQVTVTAHVTGVPGDVVMSYVAPAAPKPVVHKQAAPPKAVPPAPSQLAPLPSFFSPPPTQAAPAHKTFWNSPQGVLAVSGGCAILIGLAILTMLSLLPSRRGVQARVGSFLTVPDAPEADSLAHTEPTGAWARLLARRAWWPEFVEQVEVARMQRGPAQVVKRAVVAALILAVLASLAAGSVLVAFVPLVLWPLVLKGVVNRKARKQRAKFIDQLPSHLQDLASALRAGRSLPGAIAVVVDGAEEPIRGEFERASTDDELGRPLDEAFLATARRMGSPDMEQVAMIAGLHRRSGSNVAEAFDRVADGARDRADMRRELRALTGQARISSLVLTSLPPLLLLVMNLIAPKYARPMFHTTPGVVLLVIASLMVFAGWRVMSKLVDVEE